LQPPWQQQTPLSLSKPYQHLPKAMLTLRCRNGLPLKLKVIAEAKAMLTPLQILFKNLLLQAMLISLFLPELENDLHPLSRRCSEYPFKSTSFT
jgi:hypothetical protein